MRKDINRVNKLTSIPKRYRKENSSDEMRAVARISPELHKDVARIMLEKNEIWQSLLENFLVDYALSNQKYLPQYIRQQVDSQQVDSQQVDSQQVDISTQE